MINNNSWESKNLVRKEPKPITNAFAYNPKRVVKELNRQTGQPKNIIRDLKTTALASGKRISKTGKTYFETRINRSDINGKLK